MKNNKFKNILTIIISLIFAGFFMYFALRGLDFKNISTALKKANYFWILFSAFFGILAYGFRAIRWNILLEPMGYKISNHNAFWTLSFGYLINLTIPRMGEIARASALYKTEKVPIEKSLGTIILERIVDLLCMGIFFILTLIFKHEAFESFYSLLNQNSSSSNKKNNTQFYFYGILAVVFIIFCILFFFRKYKKNPIISKILSFIKGFKEGVGSIFKLEKKIKFILLSLCIWICYYFSAYLIFFSMEETAHLSIFDGFFIIVVGTLGMLVPASGGIGAFHLAMKIGFSALFLSMGKNPEIGAEVGLSYGFLSHTMQIIIMLVLGIISIPLLAKSKKKKKK